MSEQNEKSNGFLYFVVGALVIAVIGVGYLSSQKSNDAEGFAAIETSAGDEGETTEFKFKMNDDGFEASKSDSE